MTLVEVKTTSGDWKPLRQFLDEDVADSKHELIRGNVVMATRYFHHRVKSFISKIVMSKSNPMKVKNYTYKVEFQERGKIFVDLYFLNDLFNLNSELQVLDMCMELFGWT